MAIGREAAAPAITAGIMLFGAAWMLFWIFFLVKLFRAATRTKWIAKKLKEQQLQLDSIHEATKALLVEHSKKKLTEEIQSASPEK